MFLIKFMRVALINALYFLSLTTYAQDEINSYCVNLEGESAEEFYYLSQLENYLEIENNFCLIIDVNINKYHILEIAKNREKIIELDFIGNYREVDKIDISSLTNLKRLNNYKLKKCRVDTTNSVNQVYFYTNKYNHNCFCNFKKIEFAYFNLKVLNRGNIISLVNGSNSLKCLAIHTKRLKIDTIPSEVFKRDIFSLAINEWKGERYLTMPHLKEKESYSLNAISLPLILSVHNINQITKLRKLQYVYFQSYEKEAFEYLEKLSHIDIVRIRLSKNVDIEIDTLYLEKKYPNIRFYTSNIRHQ